MKLWSAVTWLASCFTLSPVVEDGSQQSLPDVLDLAIPPSRISGRPGNVVVPAVSHDVATLETSIPVAPLLPPAPFQPVTGRHNWGGSNFECEYPEMRGYLPCSGESKKCWLKNGTGHTYGIDSDYEDPTLRGTPKGIVRDYTLVVEDGVWNADGFLSKDAKLVNGSYPGPWIQACWGDTVRVKVINKLKHNGTAVHFHGIRQLRTMHADGVPGITQCPIAPNDYYTYEFRALQYGSSWYHSHYSVQYADGLLGPMTVHGPSSDEWDEPKAPTLMSDWFHNSAFGVIHGKLPGYPVSLLNGTGDITKYLYNYTDNGVRKQFTVSPNAPIPAPYQIHFEKPTQGKRKRYLMRLINTSFATTFLFSIDNHRIKIIGADFVPVRPSEAYKFIQIGIGQRYTVIVEAEPVEYQNQTESWYPQKPQWDPDHMNFWIRTSVVNCFKAEVFQQPDWNKTGILRYDPSDQRTPITNPWRLEDRAEWLCKDEPGLVPRLAWKVPELPNNIGPSKMPYGEEFSVKFSPKFRNDEFPLSLWSFEKEANDASFTPLQIDYDNPMFLNLDKNLDASKPAAWKNKWVVIPENFTEDSWVFFAITQYGWRHNTKDPNYVKAAHPVTDIVLLIHLHGHDFAVIHYEDKEKFDPAKFVGWKNKNPNPMRRDVVLLPSQGFIIIGFKTDNPGSWIMHCHIAFHASEGLALQVNERQAEANRIFPNVTIGPGGPAYADAHRDASRLCKRWSGFQRDCTRHWPGYNDTLNCWPACNSSKTEDMPFACPLFNNPLPNHVFQDDSGI